MRNRRSKRGLTVEPGMGKIYQLAYCLALVLAFVTYFVRRFLPDSQFFYLTTISLGVSGAVFLVSLFLRGWSLQSLVACGASLVFLFLMPYRFYTLSSLADFSVISFFFLSTAVDRQDKKLFERIFLVKLLVGAVVLALYNLKVLPDVMTTRVQDGQELIRHSYGFMHPNSLGMYLLSLMMDVALLEKKRSLTEFLILLTSLLLVYAVTDSRMAFLIAAGILLLLLFKPLLSRIEVGGNLVIGLMVLVLFVGISLSIFYQPDRAVLESINIALSNRLKGAHQYIQVYGFSWEPRLIHVLQWGNGTIVHNENFYIDSLLRQGFIVFALYPLVMVSQLFKKRFSLYYVALFSFCLLGAMVEDYGASLLICSPLLIGYFVQDTRKSRPAPSEWLET